jgi:hypothetical protein
LKNASKKRFLGGILGTGRLFGGAWKRAHVRNSFIIKDKRAAQGRRSGNHCGRHKIPRKISGNAGAGAAGGYFAFYSPLKILLFGREVVKGKWLNS